ncbi:hypothetical protein ERO13_A05G331700v2 [Gossypium hirsutum]|uniref:Methyltransferase n=1 Tax=Gossypium hirsutum TaxID=3635 RepID=A0ABM3BN00_GOSHI|nr:probable methyltransferase PMT22 isoform X2 [Gossypium hirsutum]KAG4202332.1 hypothetical protein ERO13_A05G331700v2 [Gossypium hirsutum]
MPISVLLSERKYSFLCLASVLLISFAFLLLTYTSCPFFFAFSLPSDIHVSVSSPPPPSRSSSLQFPTELELETQPADHLDLNVSLNIRWRACRLGSVTVDYIPCLDNSKAIKQLKSKKHLEHRERHCPKRPPRCLVPLPKGYKVPVQWPQSRDMIWYSNVPHPKLVEYKKEQNWVRKSDDYFVFPGGGTQFKNGVTAYIDFITETVPAIKWGEHIRVVLDVGCGVASFGGYLLDRDVVTMSFAPKDEHEAQIQFALERGIPATLSVIGSKKLTFPDDAYDLIHCARCRVHWEEDGGKPLLELNRILRPGGFFVWSATPVYRNDERDRYVWKSMVALTQSICWKVVAKRDNFDSTEIGLVIYQKPSSYSCYAHDRTKRPPLCDQKTKKEVSWFAAALNELPLWVMNVVPIDAQDTLSIIFERGLIGIYHDWCESLSTYPRTYDLLHSSFLFKNRQERCNIIDVAVEMDRILRPGGYLLLQDTMETIQKLNPVLRSLQWSTRLYEGQFLVGKKGFWRPKY